MKRIILGIVVVLSTVAAWQAVGLSQLSPPPQIAFDIPKADIDTLLKNSPPAVDQLNPLLLKNLPAAAK